MKISSRLSKLALAAALIVSASGVGCSSDDVQRGNRGENPSGETPEVVLPENVSVTVHGAMVRPWDSNQELWDDSQQVTPDELAALADALGAPFPYIAVGEFLADGLLGHWAPPDPFGHADVLVDGQWIQRKTLATADTNTDNTFVPNFSSTWSDLPLSGARLRVTLTDEDDFLSGADDPIGTVIIDEDQLIDAYLNGGNTAVAVDDQGDGTILFVNLSVADGPISG